MSNGKPINLELEGRNKILSFISSLGIPGIIKDVKLRRIVQQSYLKGPTVTFGVVIRPYSGGIIDIDIPLTIDLDTGEIGHPVIGFIDGEPVLLTDSLFEDLCNSYNLYGGVYSEWTDVDSPFVIGETLVYHDYNKFASEDRKDLNQAIEYFLVNLLASDEHLAKSFLKYVKSCSNPSGSLILSFGSRMPVHYLMKVAQNEDDELPPPPPPEYFDTLYDREEKDVENIEKVLEIPESYPKKIFPSVEEMLELIRTYRVIRFSYRKLNNEFTMRTIEPHYLWLTGKNNLIVIGWDYYRNNWRAFDLSRIRDVEVRFGDDWLDLGRWEAMLEKARSVGIEVYDVDKGFTPRGPYYDVITSIRGSLNAMKDRFGSCMQELILNMIDMCDLWTGRK